MSIFAAPPVEKPQSSSHRGRPVTACFLDDDRPVSRRMLLAAAALISLFYALLWSPYWYPLSDSALYLCLGRSLAEGDGLTFMGLPYKRITPFMPLTLSAIIRAGGGIGTMHALAILFMLAAHLCCFLAIRRWFNDRVALLATIATAGQYWVFRNAIYIMTEPPFLAFFWASVLAFTHIAGRRVAMQWLFFLLGVMLLAACWETRIAATFLLPGTLAALWMVHRRSAALRTRIAWVTIFVIVFAVLVWDFNRAPANAEVAQEDEFVADSGGRKDRDAVGSIDTRFKGVKPLKNVKGGFVAKAVQLPVLAGRWINESFIAPAGRLAQSKSTALRAIATVSALSSLAICAIGIVVLVKRGHWWVPCLATYAVPFWFLWGSRVLPRYYIPIAPILFIVFCTGLMFTISWLVGRLGPPRPAGRGNAVRWLPAAFAGLIVAVGLPIYAVELYVRHLGPRDFYDYARQGALAELIDICAYLRDRSSAEEIVYVNAGGLSQRVGFLLSGRRIEVPLGLNRTEITNPNDPIQLNAFLRRVPAGATHAMVWSREHGWPEWHLPLSRPADAPRKSWWLLYERDPEQHGEFRLVDVPRSREYVRQVLPGTPAEVLVKAADSITSAALRGRRHSSSEIPPSTHDPSADHEQPSEADTSTEEDQAESS